jgi:hypothetical protein
VLGDRWIANTSISLNLGSKTPEADAFESKTPRSLSMTAYLLDRGQGDPTQSKVRSASCGFN